MEAMSGFGGILVRGAVMFWRLRGGVGL